jgi:hypothetical protein
MRRMIAGIATVALMVGSCGGRTGSSAADASGPDSEYRLPPYRFSGEYFYCVVEPQIVMGGLTLKPCGDDGSHGCHYSDKDPDMPLFPLPQPVTCSGSGAVAMWTDASQVAAGTPAGRNFGSASLEMKAKYTDAPFYLYASGMGGHVQVFSPDDAAVTYILQTWASTAH